MAAAAIPHLPGDISSDMDALTKWLRSAKEGGVWKVRNKGAERLIRIQDPKSGEKHLTLLSSAGRTTRSTAKLREDITVKQLAEFCAEQRIAVVGLADALLAYNAQKKEGAAKKVDDRTITAIWNLEKELIIKAAEGGDRNFLKGISLSDAFRNKLHEEGKNPLQIALASGHAELISELVNKLNIKEFSLEDIQAILRAPPAKWPALIAAFKSSFPSALFAPVIEKAIRTNQTDILFLLQRYNVPGADNLQIHEIAGFPVPTVTSAQLKLLNQIVMKQTSFKEESFLTTANSSLITFLSNTGVKDRNGDTILNALQVLAEEDEEREESSQKDEEARAVKPETKRPLHPPGPAAAAPAAAGPEEEEFVAEEAEGEVEVTPEPKKKALVAYSHDRTETLMNAAIEREDKDLLLLLQNAKIQARDKLSPLHILCDKKPNEKIERLIHFLIANCNPDTLSSRNFDNQTAFEVASERGHTAIVAEFIRANKVDLSARGGSGKNTPLHLLCKQKTLTPNHLEVARLLIRNQAPLALDVKDAKNLTPFAAACVNAKKREERLLELNEKKPRTAAEDKEKLEIEQTLPVLYDMLKTIGAHFIKFDREPPFDLHSEIFTSLFLTNSLPGRVALELLNNLKEGLKPGSGISEELRGSITLFTNAAERMIGEGTPPQEALALAFVLDFKSKNFTDLAPLKNIFFNYDLPTPFIQAVISKAKAYLARFKERGEGLPETAAPLQDIVRLFDHLIAEKLKPIEAMHVALLSGYEIPKVASLQRFITEGGAAFAEFTEDRAITSKLKVFKANHKVYVVTPEFASGTFKTAARVTEIARDRIVQPTPRVVVRLAPKEETTPAQIKDMAQEIQIAKELERPGVASLFHEVHELPSDQAALIEVIKSRGFLVEPCETAEQVIAQVKKEENPITALKNRLERLDLFIDILEDLQELHRKGYVWGDAKAENCLVRMVEGRLRARISDFGTAFKFKKGETEPPRDSPFRKKSYGSPGNTSPEIVEQGVSLARGDKDFDYQKTDIWAVGIIWKRLLDGQEWMPDMTQKDLTTSGLPGYKERIRETVAAPYTALQAKPEPEQSVMDKADITSFELLQGLMNQNPDERWTAEASVEQAKAAKAKLQAQLDALRAAAPAPAAARPRTLSAGDAGAKPIVFPRPQPAAMGKTPPKGFGLGLDTPKGVTNFRKKTPPT